MMQNARSKKSVGVRCDIMPVYNNIKQTKNMKQPVIKKKHTFLACAGNKKTGRKNINETDMSKLRCSA